jgi:hypothetical protein
MSHESTDTNSQYPNKEIPDGRHNFTVEKVVGKTLGKAYGYVWTLEEKEVLYEQVLFGSEMKELLKILKCNEVSPGKFEWDTDQVNGLSFSVDVSHVPDKKKPDVMRQKFSNYKEDEIPF